MCNCSVSLVGIKKYTFKMLKKPEAMFHSKLTLSYYSCLEREWIGENITMMLQLCQRKQKHASSSKKTAEE